MKKKLLIPVICSILLSLPAPLHAEAKPSDLQHERITVLTSEGLALSAFVTRAKSANGALPALFFTQAVSCGSIAPRPDRLSRQERVALSAGYAIIRVDRSGSGESDGAGCDKLDYDTEVRHYREAFDQLTRHPWVKPDQIVIMGSSLGSTTAPLVAQGKSVMGVVVQGAGALTYFERMLHFDRIQLERQQDFQPEQIFQEMQKRIEFQQHYLRGKETPEQIEAKHPHLQGVWQSLLGTDAAPHYGRPYAWHWQAADKNWLAAWTRIDAPAMVVYGEYEQFESRHGHRLIVDSINRLRPGTATWLEIPRAGHGLRIYPDQVTAYTFEGGQDKPELFVQPVANWLRKILRDRQKK
ncbi:MAG: alpha/beta fold hydrolase [Parasphingorhabdus sp.]|uniref:alpha/beta fold hydrolase n=1 Tax=Parasphingorhabdus sp. TaxID=2709688 RepID=UPI0032986B1D